MSSHEDDLASLQPPPESAPEHIEDAPKALDIEMTPSLTEIGSSRRPISPSTTPTNMSQIQYGSPSADVTSNFPYHTYQRVEHGQKTPLNMICPGPVWPTDNQVHLAYAYGIRREDGTYTQLIPVDQIGHLDLSRIPMNQGPEGLIILPPPQLPRPEIRSGTWMEYETVDSDVSRVLLLKRPH